VSSWGGPGQGYEWPAQNAGIAIDPSGNLWIGGMGGTDTRVLKFTKEGKFVAQYGSAGQAPAPAAAAAADTAYAGQSPARGAGAAGRGGGRGGRGGRGGAPALPAASTNTERFGGATGFAFAGGDAYVADGSRNRRVAVVDMNSGSIKRFFGAYGAAPDDVVPTTYAPNDPPSKQFSGVRCVESASDGTLYVCDARNNRIQVFGKDGKFVKEARLAPNTLGGGSVWDIAFSRDAQQRYVYVADGSNMKVHVLDRQSLELLTSFGEGGRFAGEFLAVSGVATDSKGNLYTVEGAEGKRLQRFVFKGVGSVSRNQGVLWPK
jgi:DNA-binding beta-propeller fold protein YncE